ncbi:hypothetical protein C8Q80DRAFT_631045 [Daedaleopsis nitida]|nr:hypothetical protein C8Q80DRAFT_631045 [Daedaleopsis nitida]
MCFDSSPPTHAHDFSYADRWSDSRPSSPYRHKVETPRMLEPARIPFYPLPTDTPQPGQMGLASRDYLTPPFTPTSATRRNIVEDDRDWNLPVPPVVARSATAYFSSTPTLLGLPPSLTQAHYLSDVPALGDLSVSCSPLPPSDPSGFIWPGRTSYWPESDEIPQASFSASQCDEDELGEPWSDHEQAHDLTRPLSQSSTSSLLVESLEPVATETSPQCLEPRNPEIVCLSDVLGELFEGADPWKALDDVLDLPATTETLCQVSDLIYLADHRLGVGHTRPEPLPSTPERSPSISAGDTYRCLRKVSMTPYLGGPRAISSTPDHPHPILVEVLLPTLSTPNTSLRTQSRPSASACLPSSVRAEGVHSSLGHSGVDSAIFSQYDSPSRAHSSEDAEAGNPVEESCADRRLSSDDSIAVVDVDGPSLFADEEESSPDSEE